VEREECHPNEGEFARLLAERLSGWTVAKTLERFAEGGVPAVSVLPGDSKAFLEGAQGTENGMVVERRHPNMGAMRIAWNYIDFGDTRSSTGRPTPLLGEQTEAVLRELGYDTGEIAALYSSGIVHTEMPVGSSR